MFTASGAEALSKIFFISQRLIVFDGMEDVFEHIVRTATSITQAEAATIRVFDIESGKLEIVKGYGVSHGFLAQPAIRVGEGITGRVVLEGKPFMTDDVSKVPHYVYKESAKCEGIRSLMCIPLKTKDQCVGCITVYRKQPARFVEQDMLVLNIFGMQAAEAIEKARLVDELKRQALYDQLTGSYNKVALLRVMEKHLHLSERNSLRMSVIFIDIDDFKPFNDTHGHLLGDKLLSDFARLLQRCLRRSDSIGRFGGEEFVVLAPHTGKKQALVIAGKLRRAVAGHNFVGKAGERVAVTFSAGVASYPEDGGTVAELLNRADEAMYRGKAAGKDRTVATVARAARKSSRPPRASRRARSRA